jgi:hypothetical protein
VFCSVFELFNRERAADGYVLEFVTVFFKKSIGILVGGLPGGVEGVDG